MSTDAAPLGARILFVKLMALGDVVLASAAPAALKARDPACRVTWVCANGLAELVRLFPGVDEVLPVDAGALLRGGLGARTRAVLAAWRPLAGRRFDDVVIAHQDARYGVLALPARGRRRRMRRGTTARPLPVAGRWFADEYVRLALGYPDEGPVTRTWELADLRGRLPEGRALVPEADGRAIAVLVPGGARNALRDTPQRRWPVERYVELARRLHARGHAVVLVGDAADREVLPAFADVPVIDRLGRLRIVESTAVLEVADVVVSHDTGPMHLARLVRAPLVALFGPTSPHDFAPEDARTTVLWGGAALACRPCYDGREVAPCRDNRCMQDLGVARVEEAALAMAQSASPAEVRA
ncbi:glycosyltransferase family 9 protein [Roseisolibacter agri]|uniref:Heptosyltransferase n=1 Tax=Roseisolibacter agri TaxID=2014610 RepID=A0AA37QBX8_9BACT|nr:glycosyltransferase family 9 protein [Roseisolibacter agri]GLC27467.1 heptosyltransferase [Roseisolibacter agri]